MGNKYKYGKCMEFFEELSYWLGDQYETVGSCNADKSAYLVPKGSADEIAGTKSVANGGCKNG